ncbi:flagellar assembly peptidoglycan hydrolase FlgJ [Brenneria goodwinii]|uniref:Peptidoglycan hydrolase FlgJ n=1 Tax=Brenneria goodwinii TaxID=1109412 RepID=A0A0G4K2L9_9GAMM|nr:flagellar assembly peptidoglycan hydrolase FlgJ [Brenneria goodwinii]MCG8158121.1 flagellar assembly peptidoglycan hydrolase FlgJ [Brenneria goodwinii]MCG8162462.1 flagellar assembly peptidoglycan hydrolase FlgJ [Brenneria goodwinii]MCG8167172.1 flagellar assembly peptidoglycan hydrolase FlgJ [Brenneria goodwinii]MCG8171832.1 flagellar assembly peptidoglycan hydrolase FlgJ [Brenneria goodwinii]MCG8176536.1 flagellar assembly peptidoglycan hydrolase FlgJ [Brenneria goodwinii]
MVPSGSPSASLLDQSSAAYDVQSLNGLRREAAQNSPEALNKVAKQVEGLFVNMMLKSMRNTLPQDGLLSSDQTRMYTSMYDQQISQNLSSKGLGLADMMVKQLSRNSTAEPDEMAGKTPLPLGSERLPSTAMPPALIGEFIRRNQQDNGERQSANGGFYPTEGASFTERLSVPAMIASLQSGIPHHLILAQAALESGWGKREIMTRDGKTSHNIFGVKAGSNWDGEVASVMTTEYKNGQPYKVAQDFRVYDSYLHAINDYIRLLTQNSRYKEVLSAGSSEQAAYALQKAGYATDPNYGAKLVQIIDQIRGTAQKAVKAYTHDLSNLF